VISPTLRPLPDNTQHSQQTNIHSPSPPGNRTHDPRKRTAALDCTATGIGRQPNGKRKATRNHQVTFATEQVQFYLLLCLNFPPYLLHTLPIILSVLSLFHLSVLCSYASWSIVHVYAVLTTQTHTHTHKHTHTNKNSDFDVAKSVYHHTIQIN